MKQISKRLLGALLAIIMVVSMAPVGALTASATNASTQSTITTGSIITYGSYPQTKVTDSALITNLNAQTLQGDNTVTYGNSKYKRVYFTTATNSYQATNGYNTSTVYWFKFEKIQWRVLSNTNGELFVMAEKILASRAYNQVNTDVTWETCTMRNWLNDDFYNTAFSSTERSKIKTSTVVNANNPWFGTAGGNNTSDKLFLLSYSEVMNPAYGFSSDTARRAQGTDFSKSNGLFVYNSNPYLENSYWWLRSPGSGPYGAGLVSNDGNGYDDGSVNYPYLGARPAFKLNLTSDIFTSKVGSNCMINGLNNFIYGLDPGITSLDDYVDVAQGYELECIPSTAGFGTGTLVNVKLGEETVESYTIIIYGDVNGDGNIDSTDAGLTVDYENYIISWDPVADAATIKAGDLNGDGIIDSIDAGITVDTENHISFVNQLTGIGAGIKKVAGTVLISGLPKLGNTLTADTSTITPTNATLNYVWKRSGAVIGTDKTYIVTADDIGKSITVTVTGFGGFSGSIRSKSVVATSAVISGTVTMAGTAKYGEVLTANTSNIDPSDATLTYLWKRGDAVIGNESTYMVTAEDIGQPLSVTITGTGVYEGSITSAVIIPEKADVAAPSAPIYKTKTANSITLNTVVGQEYKIAGGEWQTDADFTGLNPNTTYKFYTRTAQTNTHYASPPSAALSVTTDRGTISGEVVITGEPKVGNTLTVDISNLAPAGVSLSYRWVLDGMQIGVGSTYSVDPADIGESIAVIVTGTGDYMGSIESQSVFVSE